MCHFITASLPAQAVEALEPLFQAAGRALHPLPDSPVRRHLPPGDVYFDTCASHCDCDTPLGSRAQRVGHEEEEEKLKTKLRRKGWSDAKIERWAQDRQKTGRGGAPRGSHVAGAEEWASLIRKGIEERGADHIGLLLHLYSGLVGEEEIPVQRTETVYLSAMSPDTLTRIEEDVLYLFRR